MPELRVVERRIYPTEFREVPGSNGLQRWARAVTYDTVDDYGTIWLPGCFNDGLGERMPTILYGHDWWTLEHVLGQGIDSRDVRTADEFGPPGCDVLVEFDDPEFVPMVRQAVYQVGKRTLRDVSVGFDRQEWLKKEDLAPEQLALGAEEAMQQALMDELSLVVRGAVPGAQMRSRSFVVDGHVLTEAPERVEPVPESRSEGVSFEDVIKVAKRRAAGELSLDEARAALELLDGRSTPEPSVPADAAVAVGDGVAEVVAPAEGEPPVETPEPAAEPEGAPEPGPSEEDIDAALARAKRAR